MTARNEQVSAWQQDRRTLSYSLAAVLDTLVEFIKGVQGCEDLHCTDSVEHVRIMARSSTEAAALVQTREKKVKDAVAGEGVRVAEQMQGRQPPVQAVETQVLGEPVLELVFALGRVSAEAGGKASACYAQCRGSGCRRRACRRRDASRRACRRCHRLRGPDQRPKPSGVVWQAMVSLAVMVVVVVLVVVVVAAEFGVSRGMLPERQGVRF